MKLIRKGDVKMRTNIYKKDGIILELDSGSCCDHDINLWIKGKPYIQYTWHAGIHHEFADDVTKQTLEELNDSDFVEQSFVIQEREINEFKKALRNSKVTEALKQLKVKDFENYDFESLDSEEITEMLLEEMEKTKN